MFGSVERLTRLLPQSVFTPLEVMTAVFSAAIHDVDHPGLTNQYLINTSRQPTVDTLVADQEKLMLEENLVYAKIWWLH